MYRSLDVTNWEYPNLVSMIVMRDPIERFLAYGKCYMPLDKHQYPTESLGPGGYFKGDHPVDGNATQIQLWWEYANAECADNYALSVLADSPCTNGSDTSVQCLEGAKTLLRRFTFILDQGNTRMNKSDHFL